MAVNKKNADALRAAMARVLDGSATNMDGSLTWNAVCAEAGVPRATAARADDVIAEWKAAVAARRLDAVVADKDADAAESEAETVKALRATIRTMANHIQALMLALEQKDAKPTPQCAIALVPSTRR